MPRHGQPYAKVLDFGIAKLLESADPPAATETGVAMGTAHYMSPEQCRGEGIDARTDIYAMGVLLYLMWSGRLPFEAPTFLGVVTQQITAVPEPPSAHRPIAPRLERLIMSCLEKDPAGRPPSARALGEELDAALGEALPGETLPPERAAVVPAAAREAGAGAAAVASSEAMGTTERGARRGRNRFAIAAAVTIAAAAGAGVLLAVRPRRVEAPVALAPVAPPSAPVAPPPPAPIVETPAAHAREPRPRPAPRDRAKPAAAPAAARPASPLEERGFLKENPFR
jgi:serine/threonine-protein kinase